MPSWAPASITDSSRVPATAAGQKTALGFGVVVFGVTMSE